MKKLLFVLMCAVSIQASAQYTWSGTIAVDSTTADTVFVWADKFRPNQFWSIDTRYYSLNTSDAKFGIIVSNWDDGSWSYFSVNGVSFPVTLDPVVDSYIGTNGQTKASWPFYYNCIPFIKFGIVFMKGTCSEGTFDWGLKQ